MSQSPASTPPLAWIIERQRSPELRVWGLTPTERQRRLLARAGCEVIHTLDADAEPSEAPGHSIMIVRSDAILDERLVQGLYAARNTLLVATRSGDDGWGGPVAAHVESAHAAETVAALRGAALGQRTATPANLRVARADDLASGYAAQLRKFDRPYIYSATEGDLREIEDRIFQSSYKGVTDLITKWLWPRPAAEVVRVLARSGVHPNSVTALSWILAAAAGWLFWNGAFGLGLVCGWLMTFLDTVDGKLARVTLTSSRVGHVFDHSLDLIHPPFWYLAWGLGLTGSLDAATIVVLAGYLMGRALEGFFLLAFKIETHCWRPIDSLFRTITARRNPNLILLSVGTLGGRPDLGLLMVAIWTLVSIGFHIERILQALFERSRGARIECWDEMSMSTRAIEEPPLGSGGVV
jgi:phosphatidylglycerophosphate synthase